jgi:hypothetical protein
MRRKEMRLVVVTLRKVNNPKAVGDGQVRVCM